MFVNSLTGLGEIEKDMLDLSKISGGNQWRIFTKVRLMHALPYIADSLKVAFPLALVGAIVGEFIGGNRGIGYLILSAQFNMDTALVFAALLVDHDLHDGGCRRRGAVRIPVSQLAAVAASYVAPWP